MISSVASRHEKLPVELRRCASARNASLRLSAVSLRARSMAMLAMLDQWVAEYHVVSIEDGLAEDD